MENRKEREMAGIRNQGQFHKGGKGMLLLEGLCI